MDDLRAFYEANYSPSVSYLTVAGDISQSEAIDLFRPLEEKWAAKDVATPAYPEPTPQDRSSLYFVDFPGARQSEIRVGHLTLPRTHPDFFANSVMNYQLGGNFASILNMILREEKGFTYGAFSGFSGGTYPGTFRASSGVQSNATRESLEIFRDEIARYREGVSEETLTFTRDAMALSYARQFETLGALLGMLGEIAAYDLPFDFVAGEQAVIRDMTLERHQALAQQYLDTEHMIYLVVGDAQTQIPQLQSLGLGNPILLDTDGNRLR
jgi:zinc protease